MFCPVGLLPFWFYTMKKHWFGCPPEIDELVFNTWNRELILEYEETENIYENLSKIILYDQISRHILRYTNQKDKQTYYDSKALGMFETSGMLYKLEELNEEDQTNGHGIGKPFRKNGGGAVYVKDGDKVHLVNFSQSGMKKRFMEPGRVRSFVARHHCLTNNDKTSAEYWACRWPRYFSNSGKTWW